MAVKKTDSLMELKKQIKENSIGSLYLFYGEEEYLKKVYTDKIKEQVPDGGLAEFNHIYLNGSVPLSEYDDAWESFPMMVDRKLIIIKDSNIMKAKKGKDEGESKETIKEFWLEKLNRLSDDTVVIFNEASVDKRSVIFKEISKKGTVVEFSYMSESELVTWVIGQCLNKKKKISKDVALYFVQRVDKGLNNLINELEKLYEYCDEEIYKTDIDRVVSKSLNVITFDLTDAIMANDANKAVAVLNDIRTLTKESSFAILYLMLSNFEKVLQIKLMSKKPVSEIASSMGMAPFIVSKYMSMAKRFSEETLLKMVNRVASIDMEIKQGRTDEWTALYTYVTECLHYQNEN